MTPLKKRMKEELILRGRSSRTIETYLGWVSQLARHYGRSPDRVTNEELRSYLLYLQGERQLSFSARNQAVSAIRFFYRTVMGHCPEALEKAVPYGRRPIKRPRVYSPGEVGKLLESARNLKHRTFFMLMYSAGLRMGEACQLEPHCIESARMQIRVEKSKGNKERYTLLSPKLLEQLRQYYRAYRPGKWLFYGRDPEKPMVAATAQRAFRQMVERAGLPDRGGPHSLRHSFATHLLESGVEITAVQRLLGHGNIKTTMVYLHVRSERMAQILSPLDRLVSPGMTVG